VRARDILDPAEKACV